VPSGVGGGKRFRLREWQKEFIRDIYGNCALVEVDGEQVLRRRTRKAILSIARKNGKTALIAALVLVHLCGPEASINSEIVSAANDKDQAGQVFKYLEQIINLSPTLVDILKIVPSTKRVVYHGRGNFYRAISADARRKHGLNPVVVIFDELAQAINRELFDALETAQGAQEEPLFITISTQSPDPQHPLSQMIDDALTGVADEIVCHLYEVPDETVDIFDESVWMDANPALGDFRSLKEMQDYAAKAKRLPAFENTFRNLYLNQRVSTLTTLFPRSVWEALKGPVAFEDGEEVILALDFANRLDLAALTMLSLNGRAMRTFFWKPNDLMEEHGRRDRMDYTTWQRLEHLQECPGKSIRPDFIAQKIGEIHSLYQIRGMAYDRWRIDQIIQELDRAGLDASPDETAAIRLYPWGQGFVDMAPALDAFEEAAIHGGFTHDGNPVLTWNITNAIVEADAAGNRKFNKAKSRMRIDGAVAAAMAFGLRSKLADTDGPSVYQERGLLFL
jgi:phage terminase large subunit-like protein